VTGRAERYVRRVSRRIGVLVVLAVLLAGCGGQARDAAPERALARHDAKSHAKRALLVITVVDGDTDQRIRGARVRIDRKSDSSDRHGVALIRVDRRRALDVTASAPGYTTHRVREPFHLRRKVTIRIYRRVLQWPLYGATPERTGAQTSIRLRPPFRLMWSLGIGSMIEFPAVVSDGVAYIGNLTGTVYGISMRSGKAAWRYQTANGKMAASPAVWGDQLIVHGMDGHVWVLDKHTGRLLWRKTIGSSIESSPVVWRGVDYFGTWGGTLYALDLRTQSFRWTHYLGAKTTSSAAIAAGSVYIGDYAGNVWAIDARNGSTRWVHGVNGRVYGTPAVAYGRVFVPSSDGGSLTAFSTGGTYLWRIDTGSYVYSSPAAWGGRVFFGSYNGVFYGVSAATGSVLWEVGLGGPISGAAVVVDGVAYAGSFADRIFGVDARSGRVLLRFPHGHYVPVSGNGGLLLLHGYSQLYAVAPR
jgi:outer membrane protein assembly factor BamB